MKVHRITYSTKQNRISPNYIGRVDYSDYGDADREEKVAEPTFTVSISVWEAEEKELFPQNEVIQLNNWIKNKPSFVGDVEVPAEIRADVDALYGKPVLDKSFQYTREQLVEEGITLETKTFYVIYGEVSEQMAGGLLFAAIKKTRNGDYGFSHAPLSFSRKDNETSENRKENILSDLKDLLDSAE